MLCFACPCVQKKFTKNTKLFSMAASPDTASPEGISLHRLLYFSPCTWMHCATKRILLPLKQTKKTYLAYLLVHVHINFYSTDLNLATLSNRYSTLKLKRFSAHELEGAGLWPSIGQIHTENRHLVKNTVCQLQRKRHTKWLKCLPQNLAIILIKT